MSERPDPFAFRSSGSIGSIAPTEPVRATRRAPGLTIAGAFALGGVIVIFAGLVGLVALGRTGGSSPDASSAVSPAPPSTSFLIADPLPAPAIELTDATGSRRTLAALRGGPVLVFFGYTHCPDVCPATIGTVGAVIADVGGGLRALFVSVDPERDTVPWLAEFTRFMPAGFSALTGSATEIRATADAWGVKYARVETGSKDGYSMSHTADVFLVDANGMLRARFPFGTEPEPMAAVVRTVVASTAVASATPGGAAIPSAAPTSIPSTSPRPTEVQDLRPEVISTSIWAGPAGPVIVHLADISGPLDDQAIRATMQLLDEDGAPVGPVVNATAVRPPGIARVSHVATLAVPTPGPWRLRVIAFRGGRTTSGEARFVALDPGATIAVGAPAPRVATPTVGSAGSLLAVTTDPNPDPRLSTRSTADLLAARTPFVLVIDSVRFRVTPACGKAVSLARYLADRWTDVGFVHLEPYRYSIVTDTAVLDGDIADPPMSGIAGAWGVGPAPWGATSVPWVYLVDGAGIVRAKYQGLIGSDDVDVILALLTGRTGG